MSLKEDGMARAKRETEAFMAQRERVIAEDRQFANYAVEQGKIPEWCGNFLFEAVTCRRDMAMCLRQLVKGDEPRWMALYGKDLDKLGLLDPETVQKNLANDRRMAVENLELDLRKLQSLESQCVRGHLRRSLSEDLRGQVSENAVMAAFHDGQRAWTNILELSEHRVPLTAEQLLRQLEVAHLPRLIIPQNNAENLFGFPVGPSTEENL